MATLRSPSLLLITVLAACTPPTHNGGSIASTTSSGPGPASDGGAPTTHAPATSTGAHTSGAYSTSEGSSNSTSTEYDGTTTGDNPDDGGQPVNFDVGQVADLLGDCTQQWGMCDEGDICVVASGPPDSISINCRPPPSRCVRELSCECVAAAMKVPEHYCSIERWGQLIIDVGGV